MKKSLSLLLILLTIFSTVSLPAYAAVDESVQAVYDALTEEMLTTDNEPAVSVTKSLNTDLSEDISLPDGVSVSFASSDTTVITDDGAVNRPLNSKAQVTLTATISKSGSDSLTKQLSFTVLPQTSEVLASENFYYPSLVNRDLVSWDSTNNQAVLAVPNWTISNATAAKLENDITAKLLKDSNGYYNATTTRINTDSYADVAYLQYRAAGLPAVIQQPDDRFVTLTVNLNPVSWGSTTTKQFYILVEGQDASGSKNATYLQFWSDRTRVCDSAGSKLFESQNHVVSTNQNNKIEVKLDYNNKLVYLYLNDELVTPVGVSMTDTNYIRQINNVSIGYYRGMTGAVMQVNDFTLTKETAYCVASPQGVTAEMLACGQDPAFITEDLTMPANSEITWTSDNPSVIAADGTVTRPAAEDAVVTLTATDGASSNSIAFTVKAMTVSGVAINDSFNAPFYDAGLCNQPHPSFTATSTATASATYKNVGADYYLDYATTSTYASSQVTYTQTTGTDFPVGNSGKYIFAFDACFDNTAQTLFSFMGNGVNAVRFNNSKGALKVSNSSNEWYNNDNKTYATITAGKWYDVKLVIDTLAETPSFTLYFDGASVASSTLISGSAFDASIGMNIRTRDNASGSAFGVKIDNFKLYTESTPDEAIKSMSNADKASYFAKLISESTVTTEKSYLIENDLLLTAPYAAFDLDEMGVAITWSSSDPSVISPTGSVSRQENNRYVVMKA
ncbi:MAG: immunoglobulin-like domain-containing protein, partial [Clostridia bacterium]